MKKEQKRTKIGLITTLALAPVLVAGVTFGVLISYNKPTQQQTSLKALKIGDIDNMSSKQGESISSNIIEVKCFDQNMQEILSEDKPKLTLYDETQNTSQYDWISVNQETNQIVVDATAPVGNYVFYMRASCTQNNEIILSDFKQVNVEIVSTEPAIDTLILDGFGYYELPDNSQKTTTYKLKAWSNGQEVDFPEDREVNCEFKATKIFDVECTPPTFTWTREGNKILLNITSYNYVTAEAYDFFVKVTSPGDPSLCFTSCNTIRVWNSGSR